MSLEKKRWGVTETVNSNDEQLTTLSPEIYIDSLKKKSAFVVRYIAA